MNFKTIKYEIDENVLTITLNRPEQMNAFNIQMGADIISALDEADKDDSIRVIIFTGEGKAFCAGADISGGSFGDKDSPEIKKLNDILKKTITLASGEEVIPDPGGVISIRIMNCMKPVIAAINGAAVGFGATMTLPMDIRIASENAKMGFVFLRRGIVPDGASSWFLPRIVGISKALEWIISGRILKPDEAMRGGLLSSVQKPENLMAKARELAAEIADNVSPVSIAYARQLLWRTSGQDHPMQAHVMESYGMHYRAWSKDAMEGVTSFFEKSG